MNNFNMYYMNACHKKKKNFEIHMESYSFEDTFLLSGNSSCLLSQKGEYCHKYVGMLCWRDFYCEKMQVFCLIDKNGSARSVKEWEGVKRALETNFYSSLPSHIKTPPLPRFLYICCRVTDACIRKYTLCDLNWLWC